VKKHKIVSLLLVSSILASVTSSVNADNEVTDIKKYILLDMTQNSGIDGYDTNNDGCINVFDVNRIKNRIINNPDLPVTTTSTVQTPPTTTSTLQTPSTTISTLQTPSTTTSTVQTPPTTTSTLQNPSTTTSTVQTPPTTTSTLQAPPATTSTLQAPPTTTSTLQAPPTTTPAPQTSQPATSAPQTSQTTVTTTNAPAVTTTNAPSSVPGLDEKSIYNAMIAFKSQYPEGTPWTNDNSYVWNGGIYKTGYGCAGFAFMLSDAAFGKLPARKIVSANVSDIRVGDILRINNDTHSVIVLQITDEGVVLAEGNYNRSVHWGRKLTWAETKNTLTYIMTRYPD